MTASAPTVAYFERAPGPGRHSIERIFSAVRDALPREWNAFSVHCPTPAEGPLWLPNGIWHAMSSKADINHIAGDIHYVALGLTGRSTVLTIHDLNHIEKLSGFRAALYRWLYFNWPLKRSAAITAVSKCTRDRLVGMFPFIAAKIHVIPDCLPAGFEPKPKRFDATRPRILQIGTSPHKNLERLAEALHGCGCVLHVIGPLSEAQRLLLRRLQIDYENACEVSDADIVKAYEEADVVTFLSLSEGFGMPIIEAQATRRVVVASDLPPMNEVADRGACLVDAYNVTDIRRGIDRVIKDEAYRCKLIEDGVENVRRFSPSLVAARYVELYSSLLAR